MAARESSRSREARYRDDARMRSQEYTGYHHVAGCNACDLKSICDGFYGDYVAFFGAEAAKSISLGGAVDDPQHFARHQRKRVHPDDLGWLES